MKNSGVFTQTWNQILSKFSKKASSDQSAPQTPAAESVSAPEETAGSNGKHIWSIVWRIMFALRKVVMAVPVVYCALKLAACNQENLPVLVGINLQSNGEFAQMISRETAVNVPLMITGACLVLMVFSRKTVYPWLISIFTLILPILLLVTNGYLG